MEKFKLKAIFFKHTSYNLVSLVICTASNCIFHRNNQGEFLLRSTDNSFQAKSCQTKDRKNLLHLTVKGQNNSSLTISLHGINTGAMSAASPKKNRISANFFGYLPPFTNRTGLKQSLRPKSDMQTIQGTRAAGNLVNQMKFIMVSSIVPTLGAGCQLLCSYNCILKCSLFALLYVRATP